MSRQNIGTGLSWEEARCPDCPGIFALTLSSYSVYTNGLCRPYTNVLHVIFFSYVRENIGTPGHEDSISRSTPAR
jgi:hypothetical protein